MDKLRVCIGPDRAATDELDLGSVKQGFKTLKSAERYENSRDRRAAGAAAPPPEMTTGTPAPGAPVPASPGGTGRGVPLAAPDLARPRAAAAKAYSVEEGGRAEAKPELLVCELP